MAGPSDSLLISGVALGSMTLQLVLAFGGSLRHRSSCRALQLVLWLSYISADALAVYALGIMAHKPTHSKIFGVWAPLLLLHLGGPDTITAYSTADNELWTRHLMNMLYQISVAIYVMFTSELKGDLLAGSLIFLVVGASKYAERTVALRLASYSQLVNYCYPLVNYMSHPRYSAPCKYVVMGVRSTWQTVVTIQNVWDHEGQQATENYILCLSHALYKMNLRRYLSLHYHEGIRDETRRFFFDESLSHLSSEQIFKVTEIELKFMYDTLFSKSRGTAYSKWGTLMRIFNILLLGVGGYTVYSGLIGRQENDELVDHVRRTVAYIIISVALMVELFQLSRIVASDWTLVWLVCSDIKFSSPQLQCPTKLKKITLDLLSKVRRLRGRRYWKKSIQQYSVIDTCSSISSSKWKLAKSLSLTDFITSLYIRSTPIENEFEQFIIDQLKAISPREDSWQICRRRVALFNRNLRADLKWASNTDHENLILQWHIATTVCEIEFKRTYSTGQQNEETKRRVHLSRTLSNYCAYLLVSTPDLLPLHPDIGRLLYINVHTKLLLFLSNNSIQDLRNYVSGETFGNGDYAISDPIGNGTQLARQLLTTEIEERWNILSDFWAALLIHYASLNKKPMVHAECSALGGEFITQLWVLLGHMGLGEQ